MNTTLATIAPRREKEWQVGKWAVGEYVDLPWYACDRGGWFGKGLPGRSFSTHAEAIAYADRMVRLLSEGY